MSANERMVLSLVDDRASVSELGELIGADRVALVAVLQRLATLGLVQLGEAAARVGGLERYTGELMGAGAALADRPLLRARELTWKVRAPVLDAQAEASPQQQLEAPDLSAALQREFEELAERVQSQDPAVVLGCEPGADRETVRVTYFAAIRRYHPDRYFGKRIGPYKAMLEGIFRQLTSAHEVLLERAPAASKAPSPSPARSDARAPSDSPRGAPSESRGAQPSAPRGAQPSAPQADAPQAGALRGGDQGARGESSAAGSASHPNDTSREVPLREARPTPSSAPSAARLRSLSRLLTSKRRLEPPQEAARSAPQGPAVAPREAAREALLRFRAERAGDPRGAAWRFIHAADRAEQAGDIMAARNSLRLAIELCPDDSGLEARLTRLEREVSLKYSDDYLARGQQAERRGELVEAARLYELAAAGRDISWPLLQRAVTCLLQDGTELSRAIRIAKAAVAASPEGAAERSLLARVFHAAGMRQSAIAELERARQLSPNDPGVVALTKELGH
ncbi:MAG: hypothetical protein KIT72_18955 [Polyangiaceae bacterium]|nr:hypothetical protein [Polyangiaceae bacterium]MCW5792500.1 hypothetical protein [Polyangiaceae bacterium]